MARTIRVLRVPWEYQVKQFLILLRIQQKEDTYQRKKSGEKERQSANTTVIEYIKYQKTSKPSISAGELQAGLLQDGITPTENLPAISTIGDIIRKDLGYTDKRLHVVPEESLTKANQLRTLNYITVE